MRVLVLGCLSACGFAATTGVTHDGAIDGAFDVAAEASTASCPPSYVALSGEVSLYRIVDASSFGSQHRDCNDDAPMRTHLVVLDSAAERTAVRTFAGDVELWVGAVQMPGATGVAMGWFSITGGGVLAALWASSEPNDGDDVEDGRQDAGALKGMLLDDDDPVELRSAVCECDGLAVDPVVDTYVP